MRPRMRRPFFNLLLLPLAATTGAVAGFMRARYVSHRNVMIGLGVWALFFTLAAIALFGADKIAAKVGVRRIPENVLHWIVALGGGVGALGAMALFRHKTVDPTFRWRLFALLVVQGLGLATGYALGR